MMSLNKELGIVTLCHEDVDIFARTIVLYFLNNRFHDNKDYYWVMHNANQDILNAAYYFAELLRYDITIIEANNDITHAGGGNLAIHDVIKKSPIKYWMKMDQDVFHITKNLTDDMFTKCRILHNLHKKNFGFITPLVNINIAMVPILHEKLGWANSEDIKNNWKKYNYSDWSISPWWQSDFQVNIWERTTSLLQQSEICIDGEIVNPPLTQVGLSISNIMFPKYSFVKMHSKTDPELAFWRTFTNKGIFVDTNNFAAHYSYYNAREIINQKYRIKIFDMLDEVINDRLYPEFINIIREMNKKLSIPIHIL